jgi:hypothetical protein
MLCITRDSTMNHGPQFAHLLKLLLQYWILSLVSRSFSSVWQTQTDLIISYSCHHLTRQQCVTPWLLHREEQWSWQFDSLEAQNYYNSESKELLLEESVSVKCTDYTNMTPIITLAILSSVFKVRDDGNPWMDYLHVLVWQFNKKCEKPK